MDISKFPLPVVALIACHLPLSSALSLSCVSKSLKEHIHEQTIWSELFKRDFHKEERALVQTEYDELSDWRILYQRFYKLVTSEPLKLLFVGDGGVGKTSLVQTYLTNQFPSDDPILLEEHASIIKRNKKSIFRVNLVDTMGNSEYGRIRPLSYPGSHVVLMCFSVGSLASLDAIRDKWAGEMHPYLWEVPKLVIGTKTDLTNREVTPQMGIDMAKQVKARQYLELSAKSKEGLSEVFTLATELALKERARGPNHEKAVNTNNQAKSGKAERDCNIL